jgi:hypothetical protein
VRSLVDAGRASSDLGERQFSSTFARGLFGCCAVPRDDAIVRDNSGATCVSSLCN